VWSGKEKISQPERTKRLPDHILSFFLEIVSMAVEPIFMQEGPKDGKHKKPKKLKR
jgi:hypothetical protein